MPHRASIPTRRQRGETAVSRELPVMKILAALSVAVAATVVGGGHALTATASTVSPTAVTCVTVDGSAYGLPIPPTGVCLPTP
jgi:hypothetical protein